MLVCAFLGIMGLILASISSLILDWRNKFSKYAPNFFCNQFGGGMAPALGPLDPPVAAPYSGGGFPSHIYDADRHKQPR